MTAIAALTDRSPAPDWDRVARELDEHGCTVLEQLLQPAQCRVDGTGGQGEYPRAPLLERLDDRVPVAGLVVEDGEQQRVEVPAERVGLHV